MTTLKIERLGGFAGFGGPNSRIQSRGEIEMDQLSSDDKAAVNDLFASDDSGAKNVGADQFKYRITRTTPEGIETTEVHEEKIPHALKQTIRDEFV